MLNTIYALIKLLNLTDIFQSNQPSGSITSTKSTERRVRVDGVVDDKDDGGEVDDISHEYFLLANLGL